MSQSAASLISPKTLHSSRGYSNQNATSWLAVREKERERKKRVYVREGVATKLHIPSNYVQKYITSSASKEYMKVDGYVKHSNY